MHVATLPSFDPDLTAPSFRPRAAVALLGAALPTPWRAGFGTCADCGCPGFSGSFYTCHRGDCGHHYDRHW